MPPTPGKTRVTIRLDNDILEHFLEKVDRAGGGNYQSLINDALREYIQGARLEARGAASGSQGGQSRAESSPQDRVGEV